MALVVPWQQEGLVVTWVIKRIEPGDEWHGKLAYTGDEYWTSLLVKQR